MKSQLPEICGNKNDPRLKKKKKKGFLGCKGFSKLIKATMRHIIRLFI